MRQKDHRIWAIDAYLVDADRGSVSGTDGDVPLRAQSFQVLLYMLEHAGRLVSKNELLENVWPR